MNLYIDSDIKLHADSLIDACILTGEFKDCAVRFKQEGTNITLLSQKVTLDEYKMNDLLESLSYFVQFDIKAKQHDYGLEISLYLCDVVK